MRPRPLVAAATVVLVVMGGLAMAFGAGLFDRQPPVEPVVLPVAQPAPPVPSAEGAPALAREERLSAEEAALAAVGDGKVLRSELEIEDGERVWEVHVEHDGSWQEVEVAPDGEILGRAPDADADADTDETVVPRADAEQAALEISSGGEVRLLHLDRDSDRLEWEVVVVDGARRWLEITLDAVSGNVLDVDVEDRG